MRRFSHVLPISQVASVNGSARGCSSQALGHTLRRLILTDKRVGARGECGLLTGVQSALFNGDDAVLLIFKNGYTSATGTQEIISTPDEAIKAGSADKTQSLVAHNQVIERTLEGMGVKWLRRVDSYKVDVMRRTLEEAREYREARSAELHSVSDGRVVIRMGAENRPLAGDAIRQLAATKSSGEFEAEVVPGARRRLAARPR